MHQPTYQPIILQFPGPVYAQIVAHNSSYKSGDELHLTCKVEAEGSYSISWLKGSQALDMTDPRITHPAENELLVSNVRYDDQGTYSCIVTRGKARVSVDTEIKVQGRKIYKGLMAFSSLFKIYFINLSSPRV